MSAITAARACVPDAVDGSKGRLFPDFTRPIAVRPDARYRRYVGRELGEYCRDLAWSLERDTSVGYLPSVDAPSTYLDAVSEWYSGRTYRVSSEFCDGTIYGSAESNQAFRFWHDASHVLNDLSFSEHDEVVMARIQARVMYRKTASVLMARLIFCDIAGQVAYVQATGGQYPADQSAFTWTCVTDGIDAAVGRFA